MKATSSNKGTESAVKLSKGLSRTLTRLYAVVSGCTSRVCFRLKLTKRELFYILEIDVPLPLPLAIKGLVLLHESPE